MQRHTETQSDTQRHTEPHRDMPTEAYIETHRDKQRHTEMMCEATCTLGRLAPMMMW